MIIYYVPSTVIFIVYTLTNKTWPWPSGGCAIVEDPDNNKQTRRKKKKKEDREELVIGSAVKKTI